MPMLIAMLRKSKLGRHAVVVAGSLLMLAGCSRPPTTLADPPNSITMQLDKGETDPSVAADQAQRHCESWNKNATLDRQGQTGDKPTVTYQCR